MKKTVMIGSGNLATHLCIELNKNDYKILQVYSRNKRNAKILADKIAADYTDETANINRDADLYIISISDKAVEEVCVKIKENNIISEQIVVHTAGSLDINVLKPFFRNYGVLYPLQTFSKNKTVNFSEIPIFTEGNSKETEAKIMETAMKLSSRVSSISSKQRRNVHISAVFACNFTNHLYSLAADILEQNNISFDIIRPLIKETSEKAMLYMPALVQTGPAVRYDENVINKHLEELKDKNNLQEIYKLMSNSIYEKVKELKN